MVSAIALFYNAGLLKNATLCVIGLGNSNPKQKHRMLNNLEPNVKGEQSGAYLTHVARLDNANHSKALPRFYVRFELYWRVFWQLGVLATFYAQQDRSGWLVFYG